MYKPGYRTTEFWFTLVSFIFSGLFLFGVIKEDSTKEELIGIGTHAVESIILIAGQLGIFYKYLSSRSKYKKDYSERERRKYDEIERDIEDYIGVDEDEDPVNINEATIGELIQLPHIGLSLAKRIVDYREENGPFENKEDIMMVSGIGETTYLDIEHYIEI